MTTLAEPTTEIAARSLRQELTEFVAHTMEAEDTVSVEKLVRLAHKYFNGDDWMREALVREGLNALIPEIAGDVRHKLRQRAREGSNPDTQRDRIASVFEHTGAGFSKSLLAMTRPDHLFAAQERETAAAGHLRWAGFHRAVAKLHKDDKTTTGALPKARLSALWREHIERD